MTLTDLERRVEALERWKDYVIEPWRNPYPAPPQPSEQEKCCAASGTYACVCNRFAATPQPREQERMKGGLR